MMRRVGPTFVLVAALASLSGCIDASAFGLAGQDGGPSLAEALMWSESYPHLIVEVDAEAGVAPSRAILDEMRSTLESVTGRDQVHILGPTRIPSQGDPDTVSALVPIHKKTAQLAPTEAGVFLRDDTVILHLVYLADRLDRSSGTTAGVTLYQQGAIFLWPETYSHLKQSRSGAMVSAEPEMHRVVLMHELGHAMGLVGRGAPVLTERDDPDHPGHSGEEDSYMSGVHKVRGNLVVSDLDKRFTQADLQDLYALRAQDPALLERSIATA